MAENATLRRCGRCDGLLVGERDLDLHYGADVAQSFKLSCVNCGWVKYLNTTPQTRRTPVHTREVMFLTAKRGRRRVKPGPKREYRQRTQKYDRL